MYRCMQSLISTLMYDVFEVYTTVFLILTKHNMSPAC